MRRNDDSLVSPDWRDARTYAYTQDLPRRAWAWEFLRRNPAYRRSAERAHSRRPPEVAKLTAATVLLSAAPDSWECATWGLLWF